MANHRDLNHAEESERTGAYENPASSVKRIEGDVGHLYVQESLEEYRKCELKAIYRQRALEFQRHPTAENWQLMVAVMHEVQQRDNEQRL